MNPRITIICENSVGPISGTLGEHGFAALVETKDGAVLFDTGQGATILHNAERLKRDLGRVRIVALSHGHYDHTGGLRPLLEKCGAKTIMAHPALFAARYRVKDTGESIPIGIPYTRESLSSLGAAFDLSADFRELGSGIYLTGEVPRITGFEHGDAGLFCDEAGCRPDGVPDDQSLVIETPKGLVLLLGCCHAGIINTLEHVKKRMQRDDIYAVIGGTHLGFCGAEQLNETVDRLHRYGLKKICGSHCTGFSASARIARELPGHFHFAQVGFTLEI